MKKSALPAGHTPNAKPAISIISTTSSAKIAPSGSSLPRRISRAGGWGRRGLAEGARLALVHDRDRGDERGEEREHEAEDAGHHVRRTVQARIEEHRADHRDPAGRRLVPHQPRAARVDEAAEC